MPSKYHCSACQLTFVVGGDHQMDREFGLTQTLLGVCCECGTQHRIDRAASELGAGELILRVADGPRFVDARAPSGGSADPVRWRVLRTGFVGTTEAMQIELEACGYCQQLGTLHMDEDVELIACPCCGEASPEFVGAAMASAAQLAAHPG